MKVSRMLGERFKEAPKDCVIASHALMVRGGYIKYVGNGIYSLFTPAKRIMSKIERIIREEMDRIDGEPLGAVRKIYKRGQRACPLQGQGREQHGPRYDA